MGAPLNRINALYAAYQWEQDRIAEWFKDMLGSPGDQVNTLGERFQNTWEDYFTDIQQSNAKVMEICKIAIDANTDRDALAAIRRINRKFHRRETIAKLSEETGSKANYSEYYRALSSALDLELEARDYIESYLKRGRTY